MTEHTIPSGVRAMTLARYLARAYPMLPGHALRAALKQKDVRVNGARADAGQMVSGGDRVALYLPAEQLTGPLVVLYEDGRLLAVEKPARLPVDVDADGVGEDTLIARARRRYPGARLCHRLDAGTGGVMLLALTDDAERALTDAFVAHAVDKRYACVVRGCPRPRAGQLTHYLVKRADDARVTVYDEPRPGALTARLRYEVTRAGETSRVDVALLTGRTHQIRAQFAHIGHPLVGDDKYGDRGLNKAMRQATPMLWCVEMRYNGLIFTSRPPWDSEDT